MANFYRIGAGQNWSHIGSWSATSNGASNGSAAPGTGDDAFFDSHSSGTTTIAATASCKSIDCTGYTGTLALGSQELQIQGNVKFVSGMGFTFTISSTSGAGQIRLMDSSGGSFTFTTGGKTMPKVRFDGGATGTWTLQDTYNGSTTHYAQVRFSGTGATWDCNGHNMSVDNLVLNDNATGATFKCAGVTITITGYDGGNDNATDAFYAASGATVTTNSSTIFKFTDTTNNNARFQPAASIISSGTVYWHRGASTGDTGFAGSGAITLDKIQDDGTAAHNHKYAQGVTYTLNTAANYLVNGTSGNLITLESDSTSAFTLSCSSGTVSVDYVDIIYSTASGGATFNAGANSINGGHNTGWNFLKGTRSVSGGAAYSSPMFY